MTEGKKMSWANAKISDTEADDVELKKKIEESGVNFTLNDALLNVLTGILDEMRIQTRLYAAANNMAEVPTEDAEDGVGTDDDSDEESGDVVMRNTPTKEVIPSNLKSEDEIINYYKGKIAELKNRDNTPLLDAATVDKFQIMVEENNVRIKAPWINDKGLFSGIAGGLQRMGGEYIQAGKDTHYRMPKPVIT
jgi:hypothetical protein